MAQGADTPARTFRNAGVGLAALLLASTAAAPAQAERTDVCRALASEVERVEGIPPGLVQAVMLAESGRWLERQRRTVPWPWTVTSGPETFYLPSKEEALRKVRALRAAGRTNIDVGCMQVNLHHHGKAFASIEEAIEPVSNVAYGVNFLKRLRAETRSWARATSYYHSRHRQRGEAYRTKVFRLWNDVKRELARGRPDLRLADGGDVLRGEPLGDAGRGPGPRLVIPGLVEAPPPGAIGILRGQ